MPSALTSPCNPVRLRPLQVPVDCIYETAQLPVRGSCRRCRILADLGNSRSGHCTRMGARRRGLSLAEGEVDHGNLGMGDSATRLGELCLAGGADDSTQGSVRVTPRGRDGNHPLSGRAGFVLFRILDFIFLWSIQTSMAHGSASVRGGAG